MGFFENLFHSGSSADEKIGAKIREFKKEGVLDYTPEELARIREEQREAETGFMTSVAGKARPVMKAVLFASALGLASFEKKAEAQPTGSSPTPIVSVEGLGSSSANERIPEKTITKGAGEQGSLMPDDLDIHWSSPVREKGNGEIRSFEWKKDWWKILVPGFIEAKWEKKVELKTTTNIPYEYARKFSVDEKAGQPLRAEDHEKLKQYVHDQLQTSLADKIYALAAKETAEGVYGAHHEPLGAHDLKINSIKVTGFASPEGPREEGSETLTKEDPKNMELAKVRAEAGMEAVLTSLKEMGFTEEQINKALSKTEAQEPTLSEEETTRLTEKAQEYPGANVTEQIWSMVLDYNDNKITDPETLKLMDNIFGEKRRIQVEIEYEGARKTVASVPIPLLLLALLYPLARMLRKSEKILNKQEPQSISELEAITPSPKIPVFAKPEIPDLIRNTGLPSSDSPEYQNMEEEAIANDLYLFWGEGFLDKRGLSYPTIAETMKTHFDKFDNDGERIDYLTLVVLRNWVDADIEARREAGIPEERIKDGLDYENQSEQIKWAKMHATGILDAIKTKEKDIFKNNKSEGYFYYLQDKAWALEARRRKAGRPAFTRVSWN